MVSRSSNFLKDIKSVLPFGNSKLGGRLCCFSASSYHHYYYPFRFLFLFNWPVFRSYSSLCWFIDENFLGIDLLNCYMISIISLLLQCLIRVVCNLCGNLSIDMSVIGFMLWPLSRTQCRSNW